MPCSMVMWIDFLVRFLVTHSFVGEGFSPWDWRVWNMDLEFVAGLDGLPDDLKALLEKHRARPSVRVWETGWLSFVVTLQDVPGAHWAGVVHNGGNNDAQVMWFDKKSEVIERRHLPFREALVVACAGLEVPVTV